MVDFPDLSSLGSNPSILDLLALPNATYPYFWVWILGGIWFIITSVSFFRDEAKLNKDQLVSSMAVASFAIMILATLGSLGGFVEQEPLVIMLVFNLIIIGVWFFSVRKV